MRWLISLPPPNGSIHFCLLIEVRVMGWLKPIPPVKGQATNLLHKETDNHHSVVDLKSPVNVMVSLDWKGLPERAHTDTGRPCKLHYKGTQMERSCSEVTVLTITPPCQLHVRSKCQSLCGMSQLN